MKRLGAAGVYSCRQPATASQRRMPERWEGQKLRCYQTQLLSGCRVCICFRSSSLWATVAVGLWFWFMSVQWAYSHRRPRHKNASFSFVRVAVRNVTSVFIYVTLTKLILRLCSCSRGNVCVAVAWCHLQYGRAPRYHGNTCTLGPSSTSALCLPNSICFASCTSK